MMNGVYGGSLTSKLFMNVREKMSLCYYASSGTERFKGVMVVSSGVDMDKYETARKEIMAQLEACRRGEITAEEPGIYPQLSDLQSENRRGFSLQHG